MKVIEKKETVRTNDIVVIEDESLNMKWFIDIEKLNGKLVFIKESVNFELFKEQGYKYMSKVYEMAIKSLIETI